MNGDSPHAGLLENVCSFYGINRAMVPSNADLRCHWDRMRSAHNSFRHARQQRTIPKQRRSTILADNFVYRAPEVEIEKVGTHPVDYRSRGLGETLRLGPKQLNAERPFVFAKLKVVFGARISVQNAFCRNELCGENIRALRLANSPKDRVRHASHWRKKQWKILTHPLRMFD